MDHEQEVEDLETLNAELVAALAYWFDSRATAGELAKRARAALTRATEQLSSMKGA